MCTYNVYDIAGMYRISMSMHCLDMYVFPDSEEIGGLNLRSRDGGMAQISWHNCSGMSTFLGEIPLVMLIYLPSDRSF